MPSRLIPFSLSKIQQKIEAKKQAFRVAEVRKSEMFNYHMGQRSPFAPRPLMQSKPRPLAIHTVPNYCASKRVFTLQDLKTTPFAQE